MKRPFAFATRRTSLDVIRGRDNQGTRHGGHLAQPHRQGVRTSLPSPHLHTTGGPFSTLGTSLSLSPLSYDLGDSMNHLGTGAASSSLSSLSTEVDWLDSCQFVISDAATAATEFAPQTDWHALGTFLVIMLTSIWLVQRTNAVERAVMERDQALEEVRTWKSKQLQDGGSNDSSMVTHQLNQALQEYERAVQQEEKLRNVIPGVVRIVPPTSGLASEQTAREAAKQFLGKDYDIGVDKSVKENPNGQLPAVSLAILAILGLVLTSLLVFLSMSDPMMALSSSSDQSSWSSTQ